MGNTSYSIQAVEKAILILELLAEQTEPIGIAEMSKATGLNKNVIFRLLHTLESRHWITAYEGPSYALSLQPFSCFSRALAQTSLQKAAKEPLSALWESTGESCYLAVLNGTKTLFVEHYDSRRDIRIHGSVGASYYSNCCAPGKVLLAHAEDSVYARTVEEGLHQQSEYSITNAEALSKELAAVLERGYATDIEEYSRGMYCFAAPVYNHSQRVVAAVGLTVLALHYTEEQLLQDLAPKVLSTSLEISRRLGADVNQIPTADTAKTS